MKIKNYVVALVLFLVSVSASAQLKTTVSTKSEVDSLITVEEMPTDKFRVVTAPFWQNWFASVGVGGQILFGDHDKQMRLIDRITPAFQVHIGKWVIPAIGLRLGAAGYELHGVVGWSGHNPLVAPNENWRNYGGYIKDFKIDPSAPNGFTADPYTNIVGGHTGYPLYQTVQRYVNFHGDVLFNLSTMISGYETNRFYTAIPYVGIGWSTTFGQKATNGESTHELNGNVGIINQFRLSRSLDLNLDVRATYVDDRFDQEYASTNGGHLHARAGRWGEGVLMATLGLSYNFQYRGKRGYDRPMNTTIRVNESVLAAMRKRVGQLEADNEALRQQLSELQKAADREVTRENVVAQPLLVTFPIDRWTLSNKDRVNLGFLAEAIKANPGMVYSVTGYADRGTGSVKRNIFLARKRSEVIYNCLVSEFGVPENQLRRDDKGGVENMYYNDPRCSRAVLVKVSE